MKVPFFRIYAFLALLILSFGQAFAAQVRIEAKMDSVKTLMGRLASMKVEVVRTAGAPGLFPQFRECPSDGYVAFNGDSVEMRHPKLVDSVVRDGKEFLSYEIPVQVFDSGYYTLPQILYVSGGDTARSERLALEVYPVAVTANDSIAPFSPVLGPDGFSVFDWVPDWLAEWWWLLVVLILAAAAFVYAMHRYKKDGSVLPPKPLPSPYKQALSRLETLHARKLWEKGMEKEYFTELTDILRVYLYRRFGINAMEMTSRQIIDTLSDNPAVKDKRAYMRNILNMADFVKFAKVRPLPADNVAAYEDAVHFVEETKPTPEEEQAIIDKEMALRASALSEGKASTHYSSSRSSGKKMKGKFGKSKKNSR